METLAVGCGAGFSGDRTDAAPPVVRTLVDNRSRDAQAIAWGDLKIDKVTFELAQLRRLKFGRSSEQLAVDQGALFEEAVTEDIAAAEDTLAELRAASAATAKPASRRVAKKAITVLCLNARTVIIPQHCCRLQALYLCSC